ncbi:MAG: exodeoxyribonuclease VII large subunit [Clostridium sp.]|nr:exodeoxyribonuclease VII large subunit [Clostridium sp.]
MRLKTMSVTDLNTYIKRNFDNDFILSNISISGELSNFKAHSSGHMYFTLKDEGSRINCVMFKSDAFNLKMKPKDGMQVIIKGRVNVYIKQGQYQLYANDMEEIGLGDIYLEFERNKEKLFKEGLFDENIKKEIPVFPKKIAVITASTGAAIRDIINVSKRRNPGIELIVYRALVQGEGSREDLITRLKEVNERDDIDIVILSRGGGAYEDLQSFNDINLAYEIRKSHIPVVTGIGHEIDYTIADFVADYRAATPSQAAEITVPSIVDLKNDLNYRRNLLTNLFSGKIKLEKQELQNNLGRLNSNSPKIFILNEYLRLSDIEKSINSLYKNKLLKEKEKVKSLTSLLDAYNPFNVLEKGYAMIYDTKGKVITRAKDLDGKRKIKIVFKDGERVLEGFKNVKK